MSDDVQLPRDDSAEQYCIGCLVKFPADAAKLFDRLTATDFFDPEHQKIFAAAQRQFVAGGIDPVLLGRAVGDCRTLVDLGINPHKAPSTVAHIPDEAAKIIEARRKRQIFAIAHDAAGSALNGQTACDVARALAAELEEYQREATTDKLRDKFTLAELRNDYPALNPPVVDGLFRQGETVNIIANSKAGKSWMGYGLALSIVCGEPWLGRFHTSRGKVLLIDNELHRCTLAHRIPIVGDAMGIPRDEYEHDLEIKPLRGNLRSLADVAEEIEPGEYRAVLCDAKYRFSVAGVSENDNAAETQLYNLLDRHAQRTGAAFVLIHHASKGDQSDKRVTDIGAGAGAQSRAADCHIALREHEDPGVIVLEAAVRSFAPVEPLALRWMFPLWVSDDGVDTGKLKGRLKANEQRQNDRDREGIGQIATALLNGPATARTLRRLTGLSKDRQDRLLDQLEAEGKVTTSEIKIKGNATREYTLVKDAE